MANLFIPHWFGCFAGKKTIFKDSKNSPQSTKGGKTATETMMSFFGITMKFTIIRKTYVL